MFRARLWAGPTWPLQAKVNQCLQIQNMYALPYLAFAMQMNYIFFTKY